ncbi:DUF305 domain-containing protein [Flavisolibacter sp. BT320]|nr:DUF305 domain-containing protein [Flavisolibacter longurius]
MKRNTIFGLATALVLAACGNSANESPTNSADSATNTQSNAAAAPTTDNSSVTTPTTAATSFKVVMDNMMQDMHSMQTTQDPDHDFATMMKHHHQGAIDMANIELAKGTNAELKQVAQKMVDDAQKDIIELNTFLSSHQPTKKSDFAKNQMDKMMKSTNMKLTESGDVDKDFAMMMVMHHQHGIDMSKDYLKVGTAAETKGVANRTIKTNGADLTILKTYTGNAASTDHSGHDMSEMNKTEAKKETPKKATQKKEAVPTDHSQHQ